MFTLEDRHWLIEHMPAFSSIEASQSSWLSQEAVRAYLCHYHLDIEQTGHRFGTLSAEGYQIACHYWLPQCDSEQLKGKVVVVHGYYDHAGLYQHIIRHLLSLRFAVVCYDQPGHGLSSGERATIDSFDKYRKVLATVVGTVDHLSPNAHPTHVLAQSMGGAVALDFISSGESPSFDKAILLAPLVKPMQWTLSKGLFWLLKSLIKSVPRGFTRNSHDKQFLDFLHHKDPLQHRWVPLQWVGAMKAWIDKLSGLRPQTSALLVVQGTADQTVDWRENRRLIEGTFCHCNYVLIEEGCHHLVNEAEDFRNKIFDAIDQYLLDD